MKWGMWTSSPRRSPGETSRATRYRHYTAESLGSQPCGAGAARGDGEGGRGAAAHALISRWPGEGQGEHAWKRRAETPGDVHPTRLGVESFMWVNSCLPCSSEGIAPSPVCPASLLTLLSP